ncbi:letm1-like protein [Niveomyces insectorum RCEF 264]|uniref:Letm1-like protein n=1 Tax=Niveomyces insectorum RCEF 264 TaxID=1081102 RepID=A0A167S299_9HYPO|nr:letm1-like protein [Niveomyces insectorum RCEF 264]
MPPQSRRRKRHQPRRQLRPPPLTLPERTPDTSTSSHLLSTAKAYLGFYKTGMRYLWANTKLVRALPRPRDDDGDTATTRAQRLLRLRWRHDMRRLPVFGVLLVVCGELTPLVVLLVPHVVPYPCRIPKQVDKLLRQAEARRAASFARGTGGGGGDEDADSEMKQKEAGLVRVDPLSERLTDAAAVHICRSLQLLPPLWDRFGSPFPTLARRTAMRALRALASDDAQLRACGGVAALAPAEEVRLACAARGLDVRAVDELTLRARLDAWLALTETAAADRRRTRDSGHDEDSGDGDQVQAMQIALLTRRPEQWPQR